MLLLGVVEGARIIWAYITVQNAAREAARYAVTGRPFACSSDPGADDVPAAYNPANYCDDVSRGDPWSPQVLTSTRVKAIKEEAAKHGNTLNVTIMATGSLQMFNDHRETPGAFGVAVMGQDATNQGGLADYAGQPGWDVRVETYYNVIMFDPIYDFIMGGNSVHLAGQVELQNEGIDPSVSGYTGGITFQSDSCAPNCGSSTVPYISVQDEFNDFSEPQGSNFSVSVNDHQANTAYKLWFVHQADPAHVYSLDFVTDNLGSKLLNFVISASARPSPAGPEYKIYTTLASNTTPVAACLSDLPTNAPCFQVTMGDATVEVRNINSGEHRQQPLAQARWPISSSIPIYLYGHDVNTDYTMKFNNLNSTAAPGELLFDGSPTTIIPTDSQFGTNENNEPGYYIATGYLPGNLTIASEGPLGAVASSTLELRAADMSIAGELPGVWHPADDILYLTLLDHAPLQQYQVVFEDGVTPPFTVRADERGELNLSYVVPYGIQEPCAQVPEPGCQPVPVDLYTLDYNRGPNPNHIAGRTVSIFTPNDPYINVPGGSRWPAGSPIIIQLRRHLAFHEYDVYLQQGPVDSPSFSAPIRLGINTHENGDYNIMDYTLPISYSGYYVIRSIDPAFPDQEVAAFDIEIMDKPYITIDKGNRWPPNTEITIRLKNHPPLPHEVWVDKGGAYETFLGNVTVYSDGEGPVEYTIPLTMPTRTNPDYYPIQSYRNGALIAETKLEVAPADLWISHIDVPDVTFDIEIPITLTIANLTAVTVADTYFDTDIYVDPEAAPNPLDPGLPPGDYKNWLQDVPPNGSVTVNDTIVLFGQESHQIFGRVDTTGWVAETDESNNVTPLPIDAACPVKIVDEFLGDGLADWTQTGFGDSGPTCPTLPDLPPVGGGGDILLERNWDGSSVDGFSVVYNPFGTSGIDTGRTQFGTQSRGDPAANSLAVRIRGRQNSNPVSLGASIQFANTQPSVTIAFDHQLGLFGIDSNEWAEYYLYIDGAPYDGGTGNGWLLRTNGNGASSQYYPADSDWPRFISTIPLAPGTHTFTFGAKVGASGNWGNRSIDNTGESVYAYIDSLLITESSGAPTVPPDPAGIIWSAHYDSDAELFAFAKDAFYGYTSSGDEDPSGTYDNGEGAWANGSLYTKLGRTSGSSTYTSMTGGWSRPFTVPAGGGCVTVQGYYRLKFSDLYENTETGEVLLAVDDGGSPRLLASATGGSGAVDTGWLPFKESFTLPPGSHTLILGGYNNQATENGEITEIWFDDVYVVDSGSGVSTSTQTESSGSLILTNKGSTGHSTIGVSNDNATGSGYHFMHRTVGSGPFEVYFRVDQVPPNGSNGLAGLEIRGDHLRGSSEKIMFVLRGDGSLRLYTRVNGGSTVNAKTRSGVSAPVWLKIARNGDEFKLYYVVSGSETPPTDWGDPWETLTGFIMPASVEVGMVNAPGSSSTAYAARFKHFNLCAASAPGGSSTGGKGYLGSRCGQVEENGNGLVVVDAVNTILNQAGAGHTWKEIAQDDVLGEPSMEGLEASLDTGANLAAGAGPHATYQVNFETAGAYYVWVGGWGPNSNGDDVHVGLNGAAVGVVDGFPTGGSAPGWKQMSGSMSINAGINTIDLWVKEDGARVFKILLTNDSSFVPPPEGISQSACSIIVQPEGPPLLETCEYPLQKGDFEGAYLEVYNTWPTSGLATFTFAGYNSNRGVLFPISTIRVPTLYQDFNLPTKIMSHTTAALSLKKAVSLNGASHPDDKLYFELRRVSDGHTLVGPLLLADGQDRTTDMPPIPDFDPFHNAPDLWTAYSEDVFAGLNPLSFVEPGDAVRAYFYAPKGAAESSTDFYIDNLNLAVCTVQPEPDQTPGLGKISGKTLQGSTPLLGADVWAYADAADDGVPGPVFQTQSIQDGTYRFYNLPPGKYLVYAQIKTAAGTFFDTRRVEVYPNTESRNVVLNIQTS
ncbi:MAG: pilus assembly protein [Anaerolineae bacterium]|nr:pilus assembly protein [Anaerolineae bacterium]